MRDESNNVGGESRFAIGATQNRSGEYITVLNHIRLGHKRAHALPKENKGQMVVVLLDVLLVIVDIGDAMLPAFFICKVAVLFRWRCFTMSSMVVRFDQMSLSGQKSREISIPPCMFSLAMQ